MNVQIPIFRSSTQAASAAGPRAAPAPANTAISDAMAGLGQGAQHLVSGLQADALADQRVEAQRQEVVRRAEEDNARVNAGKAISDGHIAMSQMLDAQAKAAKPGAPGLAGNFLKDMDTYFAESAQNMPTPAAKKFYLEHAQTMRYQFFEKAKHTEALAMGAWKKDTFDKNTDNMAVVVAQDPTQYAASRALIEQTAPETGNPETDLRLKELARDKLITAAASTAIKANARGVLDALNGSMGIKPAAKYRGDAGLPAHILKITQEEGADPRMVAAIWEQESSSGKNSKTSDKGAEGGFQVIPATYRRMMGTDEGRADPINNARAGIRYIAKLQKLADGDPSLVGAGYFGGEGAIEGGRINNPEITDGRVSRQQYADSIKAKYEKFGVPSAAPLQTAFDDAGAARAPGEIKKTGVAFIDDMDVKQRLHFGQVAAQEVRRLDMEARANRDLQEKFIKKDVGEAVGVLNAGYKLDPERLARAQSVSRGTEYQYELEKAISNSNAAQQFRALPLDKQQQFLNANREQANTPDRVELFKRFEGIEREAAAQLQSDPYSYAVKVGWAPPPKQIDWTNPKASAPAIKERVVQAARAGAVAGQEMPPMSTEEAGSISKKLDNAPVAAQIQYFGDMRIALEPAEYRQVMKVVAKGSPVKARAGDIAVQHYAMILSSGTFSDTTETPAKVAETILTGENILNKTKAQKAEDGNTKSMFIPPMDLLRKAIADYGGDVWRGRADTQEQDLQVATAYYVGKAAQLGRLTKDSKDIDGGLVKEAIGASIGRLMNVNGQGNVSLPPSMPDKRFMSAVQDSFRAAIKANGLPDSTADQWSHYGLINYREPGQYVPTLGGLPVVGKDRKPIVLTVGSQFNPLIYAIPGQR